MKILSTSDYKYHYFRKYFEIEDLQYKILAMFNDPIEDQYLKLLEGIFAILFFRLCIVTQMEMYQQIDNHLSTLSTIFSLQITSILLYRD